MIDQGLERQLSDCRALLKLWTLFQTYFEAAIKGEGINPDNEKKFLDLKSRVAMLHDTFMESVEEGSQSAVGQGMLDNVIRSITLKHINRLPTADIRKMQIEWHESYLLLNEVIGELEEKQASIAKITPSQHQMMQAKKAVNRTFSSLYGSNALRGILVIGGVLFVLVGLPMMGVFSYGGLRDVGPIQKPVYAIQEFMRRYVSIPWRSIAEAKQFGAKAGGDPSLFEAFGDYVSVPVGADIPRDAQQFPRVFTSRGIQDTSGLSKLINSKEAVFEEFRVANVRRVVVFYFLLEDADTAGQAVKDFNTWAATLAPQAQDSVQRSFHIEIDWNLVILIMSDQEADARAIFEQIWQTQKTKKG